MGQVERRRWNRAEPPWVPARMMKRQVAIGKGEASVRAEVGRKKQNPLCKSAESASDAAEVREEGRS